MANDLFLPSFVAARLFVAPPLIQRSHWYRRQIASSAGKIRKVFRLNAQSPLFAMQKRRSALASSNSHKECRYHLNPKVMSFQWTVCDRRSGQAHVHQVQTS